jgi:hypothetical protein
MTLEQALDVHKYNTGYDDNDCRLAMIVLGDALLKLKIKTLLKDKKQK